MRRLLIVGGVAAGMKAAATARRQNPELDIVVMQDETDVSYSACGLPYHLANPTEIARQKLIARTVERFHEDKIDVRIRHRVEAVDLIGRRATVNDIAAARDDIIPFDEIIFATGARPITPPMHHTKGAVPIVTLRSFRDADHLRQLAFSVRRVVIIGGGYVGLEMAETFRVQGAAVTIIEAMPRLLNAFDRVVGELVVARLTSYGVEVRANARIAAVTSKGIELESDGLIEADLVLAATGVRPKVDLMVAAGVQLGTTGAVAVDERMQVGIEGVYAAGDCVESRHVVSKKPVWYPLGDVANRQGRVAGINAAGGDARFPGVLGTAIFRVFELAVARTGLGFAQAQQAGFDPERVAVRAPSRARYMPGSSPIDIILTADRGSGRILGAEVVGTDAVDKCIDVLATATWTGMVVDNIADLDLAYAPPFSPVLPPVHVAADVARKQLPVRVAPVAAPLKTGRKR
jgi:NADPH-dependent 2,4-dienoyl-CoA reductase/sulfur reductase-like enzyme